MGNRRSAQNTHDEKYEICEVLFNFYFLARTYKTLNLRKHRNLVTNTRRSTLTRENIIFVVILGWQLSDRGFCHYHLITKSAIT